MKRNNIILIGMSGVGKSFTGKKLADRIGFDFIDSDRVFEREEKMSIQDISIHYSFDDFVLRETQIVQSILPKKAVIATGGSVVYSKEAMAHLKKLGLIIYLEIDSTILLKRVGEQSGNRGIVSRNAKNFDEIYKERKELYEMYCDVKINADNGDELEKIIQYIKS